MASVVGELAALGTTLCWSFGSIFFTISSRRIGHLVVNRLRLVVGLLLLLLVHLVLTGRLLPQGITTYHLFWFGISGIVGFVIGDTLLFKSFVLIGPRLSMLIMSLVPIFGTLIAWIFMAEVLNLAEMCAIIITLSGVSWVVLARGDRTVKTNQYGLGILCGIGGALGQAVGIVLSKQGLADNFPPLVGNIIRISIATGVVWIAAGLQGHIAATLRKLNDRKAALTMCGGALLGPFLGVWLSLIAVQHTYIGIASTLMALPPIFLIPLSHWVFKEKITASMIAGTFLAVVGATLIFLL